MSNQVEVVIGQSGTSTVVELTAPGPQGIPGPTGPAGVGSFWQQGAGVPSNSLGANGDYYLNTSNGNIYGPKASGAWGSIIFNIAQGQQGPAGATGATGATGSQGTTGPAGPQGVAGPTGTAGSAGATGPAGAAGADGKTVLSGSGAPSSGTGSNGDFYIDSAASRIYGPKTSGAWGSGTSLVGAAGATGATGAAGSTGATGATGAAGAAGVNGRTILNGSGAPVSGTGADGDFYIDAAASRIYGPKASGAWGGGTSLVGAPGSSGSDGREVEFRTSGGYIQWRYEGEASWTDLVTLASVTGPAGSPGAAGSTGATGAAGAAATISVGSVTTGAAGSSASVSNTGTSSAAVLAFSIPRGDTGATGATGSTGATGPSGVVAATAPLAYNSGTQTVSIAAATTSAAGSMSSADKTKLDAITGTNTGDQTITLTGEVTGSGSGSFAATVANSAVIGKVLTGYTSGAGTVAATDSILQAIQKLNGNDAAFLASATAATTYQPLDADLTSIAALSTASAGRSLLTLAAVPSGALVGTSDTQTLTAKTLGNLKETTYTITDGAAFEIDPANGPIQTVTLGANRTPAATSFASGQSVKLKIDDGTAFAITWTTVGVVWIGQTAGASGTAPTLGTTGWTHIELWKEGSIIYGALIGYSAT